MSTGPMPSERGHMPTIMSRTRPGASHWHALELALAPLIRGDQFTVLAFQQEDGLARRVYSNNERDYPSGGSKDLMGSPWAEHVIRQGRLLICKSPQDMRWAFADHQILADLGFTTAINVPIRQGEGVAWTVNMVRGPQSFTDEDGEFALLTVESWILNF
ncbi:MAG TPA: GAF domain-containing protein [Ramlibacter sp.]|nr:GAF domain-containing protein [Ramlibacter sp.]